MNLAHIILDPKTDFGMVLMTNIGGKNATKRSGTRGRAIQEITGKE
jgi:hypothetical protein